MVNFDLKLLDLTKLKMLLTHLKERGYYFQNQSPTSLLKLRRDPTQNSLIKMLGLGLTVPSEDLSSLPEEIKNWIYSLTPGSNKNKLSFPLSITTDIDGNLQIHDHWPPKNESSDYIHFGRESGYIKREIDELGFLLKDKLVLDLGCGQGVMSFPAARLGAKVLGVDCSHRSIDLATILAQLENISDCDFKQAVIGDDNKALSLIREFQVDKPIDLIVFNPPLVVSESDKKIVYRDGGKFGIEVPLIFINFLKTIQNYKEAWFICGDPMVGGKRLILNYLKKESFQINERRVLQPNFNQEINKNQQIKNIELVLYKIKP